MDENAIMIIVIVSAVAIFVGIRVYMKYRKRRADKALIARRKAEMELDAQQERQEQIERQKRRNEFYGKVYELSARYGEANYVAKLSDENLEDCIISFNSTQKLLINGQLVKFEDVISCELRDDPSIYKGSVTYETEKDNADFWKRAIIGHMLDRSRGAQIGALTAKQRTVEHHRPDVVIHNYIIDIQLNDLDNPLMVVKFGDEEMAAKRAFAFLNVLALRNHPK